MYQPLDPFPNIRCLDLNDPLDLYRFLYVLEGNCRGGDVSSLDNLNNSDIVSLDLQLSQLQCASRRLYDIISRPVFVDQDRARQSPVPVIINCVVVEGDYIDSESRSSYPIAYTWPYLDYPRRTTRLHFFHQSIDAMKAELLPFWEEFDGVDNCYCGFAVLHSSHPATLGRTVLPCPGASNSWTVLATREPFRANLSGRQLSVYATSFMQHDERVAPCASAAIWMAASVHSRRFSFKLPQRTMVDITELATKTPFSGLGPQIGAGLNAAQMIAALREVGLDSVILRPDVKFTDKNTPISSLNNIYDFICCYIDSGVPVIMILKTHSGDYHAIVAVGYRFTNEIRSSYIVPDGLAEDAGGGLAHSSWCQDILVHDDQMGMYIPLRILEGTKISNGNPILEPALDYQDNDGRKWYDNAELLSLIVPVPVNHALLPHQARSKSFVAIRRLPADSRFPGPNLPVYRTHFVGSNLYRDHMLKFSNKSHDYPAEMQLSDWLAGMTYPQFIWVTELIARSNDDNPFLRNEHVTSIAIIDPASPAASVDSVLISSPGVLKRVHNCDEYGQHRWKTHELSSADSAPIFIRYPLIPPLD